MARGDCANPLCEAEIIGKFRTTAGLVLEAAHVARIEQAVRDVATLDNARALDELMRPALPAQAQKRSAGAA